LNYCPNCSAKVSLKIPEGDNRERYVCDSCNTIHYSNPNVVVGTLPAFEDKILLCKRAIEPRVGLWTVPAGFLENGESLLQGAWRETKEETQAEVDMKEILTIFNIPQINQIYVIYRADIEDNSFGPTSESLDVQLFSYDEVPWEELAFPFVPKTINHYYECLKTKKFNLHTEDIIRR
jgi:ADP-ribose pyrophosphatase YjhB (NUDIX family)|tara:strand:+ start:629 stop:1162 length:534 start_codon:yes stop_codon:yes gene_type:complete